MKQSSAAQLGWAWTHRVHVARELLKILAVFSLGPATLLFAFGYYMEGLAAKGATQDTPPSASCARQAGNVSEARYPTPESVKADFLGGKLTREQAMQILVQQFVMK